MFILEYYLIFPFKRYCSQNISACDRHIVPQTAQYIVGWAELASQSTSHPVLISRLSEIELAPICTI